MATQPLANQRIGLFGKGAPGESIRAVVLSPALRELGSPVLVFDAESTNVGLSTAPGIESPARERVREPAGAASGGGP